MAQLGITFSRWFVSTLIIIVAGIPLSLAIGGFSNLRRVAMPMIILSFSVPVIVFYPVFVFWGYDEASYVIPAVIGAFPPLYIAVVRSMENTGRRYYKIGRSFSYSKQKIIRKIMLPAVILDIFGGLRTSLNAILVIVVTIEMISTSSGIGSEIQNMFSRFMVSDMLAAVMVTAAFGLILNFSFSLAVKKMWVIR
jgi:sulfonate transport system permease protein